MPLVVRELVIRATVEQSVPNTGAGAAEDSGGSRGAGKDVVTECVDQVLEILRESEQR